MSITAALALVSAACVWNDPGSHKYMGDLVSAVDTYKEIPNIVRNKLKEKIAARKYDDIATISRYGVQGAASYANLRQMHFGEGDICNTITFDHWPIGMEERGLVFCEGDVCIIIPTVCRNVSLIDKLSTPNNISFLQAKEYDPKLNEATDVKLDPVAFSLSETISSEEEPKDEYIGTGLYRSGAWTLIPVAPAVPAAPIAPIPEPSTWGLTMLGLAAIAAFNWYRGKK